MAGFSVWIIFHEPLAEQTQSQANNASIQDVLLANLIALNDPETTLYRLKPN